MTGREDAESQKFLEHVLDAKAGDDRGQHDAEERDVCALDRKRNREHHAQADQPERDHPADHDRHLGADLASAQHLGRFAGEQPRHNHK